MNWIDQFHNELMSTKQKRKPGAEYADVLILNGYFNDGGRKWYHMAQDMTVLCRICRTREGRVAFFAPVRAVGSSIYEGRTIDISDAVIV